MKRFIVTLSLLVGITAFGYAQQGDDSGDKIKLTIIIDNIKSDKGDILVGVYDKFTKTYELSERYIGELIKAKEGSMSVTFYVPKGSYSIVSIHDENSNQFLDKNFFHLPKEPFAISNGIRIPNWKKSMVYVERDTTVKLELK